MAITKYTKATTAVQSLPDRPNQNGYTAAQIKISFDQAAIDQKAYINDVLTVEIDNLDSNNIKDNGTQTIAGVKTFSSSPIVPTPTTDMQSSTKKYVDDAKIVITNETNAKVTILNGDISTLQGRATTSEGRLTSLEPRVTILDSRIDNLNLGSLQGFTVSELKNNFTATGNVTHIPIGITLFDANTDTLEATFNGSELMIGSEYVVNVDGVSIDLLGWNLKAGDLIHFDSIKTIAKPIGQLDGEILAEVVQARGTEVTLQARLNKSDSQLADSVQQLPIKTVLNPTIADDISKGYLVGKHLINTATGEEWICTNNTLNNAIWQRFSYDKLIKIYGVKIDTTNSNPLSALIYTDNAVGFTPALGNNGVFNAGSWTDKFPFNAIKPCLYKNGAVNYYLNPNNYAQKVDGVTASDITSGTDGDVMIEFPKIYWKFETIGTDLYIKYSDTQIDSTYKCLAHLRGTTEKDKCYISAYMGYSLTSKLRSLSGKTPTATTTIGAFRTLAQANGAGYDQMAYYQLLMLQVLYTIMFKNRDSQTALGRGYVDGNIASIATGGSNAKGMFYGETTGKLQNKFCGIEDFYGNCYYWIDGFFSDASRNILIANQIFNDTGSGYANYGVGAIADVSGYISTIQGTTETGFVIKAATGSTTTHYCDFGGLAASILPAFGGSWTDAYDAGAFQLYGYNSTAYSYVTVAARIMAL